MNKKWTDGQPYERSRRLNHLIKLENEEYVKSVETCAYSSSLHHDENTWDMLNAATFKSSCKREEMDSKMATREPIQQIGINPFMGQNSYIHDVSIRDQFLKPINTNDD
jgi:hypothetical protein